MNSFKIVAEDGQVIRFEYYLEAAPITSAAFDSLLPFERTFVHARISGEEIWTNVSSESLSASTTSHCPKGFRSNMQLQ
jgi:hypothetical protein